MATTKAEKSSKVVELQGKIQASSSIFVVNFSGMTVAESGTLRENAHEHGFEVVVSKNTLFRRALDGTPFSGLADEMAGPSMMFLSDEESPSKAAKIVRNLMKEDGLTINVKKVMLDGAFLQDEELKYLASVPGKVEALGMVVAVLNAPVNKLVSTLKAPMSKLSLVLDKMAKINP